MKGHDVSVEICPWLHDAPFAYSMTYDEGTVDCLANALPIHQRFGFPGHVDVVAGQLGRQRNCFGSSLNDYVHMSADELKFLIARGWGVGNHSWSHFTYPIEPGLDLYREVVWSKYRLEEMIGTPVRIFTIPNDKHNYEPVLPLVKHHYLACAYIDGAPNREDFDLYKIGNFMVASGTIDPHYDWPKELLTANLTLDYLRGSWLYETTHLVMWNVPQTHKCITPEDLARRFEKLRDLSAGRLWAAKPDDVIDYVLLRRSLTVRVLDADATHIRFELAGQWTVGIVNAQLTFRVRGLKSPTPPKVDFTADTLSGASLRRKVHAIVSDGPDCLITLDALPGRTITLST